MEAGRKNDKLNFSSEKIRTSFQRTFSRFLLLFRIFSLVHDENLKEIVKKLSHYSEKINSSLTVPTLFSPSFSHRSLLIHFHSLARVGRPKIIHNLLYFHAVYIIYCTICYNLSSCLLIFFLLFDNETKIQSVQFIAEVGERKLKKTSRLCVDYSNSLAHKYFPFLWRCTRRRVSRSQPLVTWKFFFQATPDSCIALGRKIILRRCFVMSFVVSLSLFIQLWFHLKLRNLLQKRERENFSFACQLPVFGCLRELKIVKESEFKQLKVLLGHRYSYISLFIIFLFVFWSNIDDDYLYIFW